VIVALFLIEGGSDQPTRHSASSNARGAPKGGAAHAGGGGGSASAGHRAKQGNGSNSTATPGTSAAGSKGGAAAGGGGGAASAAKGPQVIKGSTFTLTLAPGWHRTQPKNGETFAAAANDGKANATLFVRHDPNLSFSDFRSVSIAQVRRLSGGAEIVSYVRTTTATGPVVRLAANSGPHTPAYDVTLRAAGPYRYYLATSVKPNASRKAVAGAHLIHKSFAPVARGQ